MAIQNYKKALKNALASICIEVKRVEQHVESPPFFNDPYEALLYSQGGKSAAFSCPVERCTHYTGIGFSSADWHPFVETIKQYINNPLLCYENSILKLFYSRWTPRNAAEAIAGFNNTPRSFRSFPPHYLFLSPWSSLSPNEVNIDIKWWNQKDNTEHGRSDLQFPEHGWAFFGPTHQDKGQLEFDRAITLYKSIKSNGYDQSQGHIGVTLLKRGCDTLYLVGGGGYHRAAALRALDYEYLPATFHRNSIVDVDDVKHWPQVRNGLWSEKQAKDYVNYLFEFDSLEWSKEKLLINQVKHSRPLLQDTMFSEKQ